MPGMIRDGLIPFLEKAWREVGDCYEFRVANERIKVIAHPDDVAAMLLDRRHKYIKGAAYDQFRGQIGRGLISSEGELWRRQRRIIQPSFYRDTVRKFGAGMVTQTNSMIERWVRLYGDGRPFDVHAEMMRLALEIIAQSLFELELRDDGLSTNAFSESLGVIAARVTAVIEAPRWMPTRANRKLARAHTALDTVIMGIIEARRRSGDDRDDMLGALLRGQDEQGQPLDDELLRDELITMFLAGHETTAVALTWTLWLLSQNADVRARMTAEIEAAVGSATPSIEDIPKLGYVKQVLLESMRLIAPVWATARNCVEHDTLGDGYLVEPGDRLMNVSWLTHKHPEFWPEPERFDPERFSPELVATRHKFAFTPFSEGPRKCIGEHFSIMESIFVLTQVFQRFDVEAAPGFAPEMDFQLSTRPRGGLLMQLRERA